MAKTLARYGEQARTAVPTLIEAITKSDSINDDHMLSDDYKKAISVAIGRLGPVAIQQLKQEYERVKAKNNKQPEARSGDFMAMLSPTAAIATGDGAGGREARG